MNYKMKKFKIGVTFSGKYRQQYVEPICNSLLMLGYSKDEIFYDSWHEVLINGPHGDDKLREIYNRQCDCVVVFLSPDYKEKNWTGNIEWPAIKELINTGGDQKICFLGIDNVKIDKIDGIYKYQAILKYIDEMSPDEVAKFISEKYIYIVDNSTYFSYSQLILEETKVFIEELASLNVIVSNGNIINIVEQLKNTAREGKRVRLEKWKNEIVKPRSVFDHIISLAYLADVMGSLIEEERWNASEIARMIAYHEIAEAIIGDIASCTVGDPLIKGPERFETSKREVIVNKFISLYADNKQQESIGYLNNRIMPTGRRRNELIAQMDYFKALDHLDCLVAVWRYLFHYRNQCTQKQLLDFITVMSDFFTNQRLKEEKIFNDIPVFKNTITFLSDKKNAKQYVTDYNIKRHFNESNKIANAMTYLIEHVALFCDDCQN